MPRAGPVRLLLVEDNPRDARLLEIVLSELPAFQHQLDRVANLTAAKARMAQGGIDAILLDLGLPESQGLPTLKAMLPAAGGVPIVVLSGQGDPESQEDALREGATAFLSKNHLTPEHLLQAIEGVLAKR
jgi:CheY-like chemotaxis protein